jgi:hypothetical protein
VLQGHDSYGWVIIEEKRSDCPPAESTFLNNVVVYLDQNNYICTSTELPDPYRASYFVRNDRGELESIPSQMISEEGAVPLRGRTFQVAWYGQPSRKRTEAANEAILRAIGADDS